MSRPPCSFPLLVLCTALLLAACRADAVVYIAEFVANNQTGFTDVDGEHSDWIELSNAGTAPVSLNGWYLSDDPGDLRKWQFPAATPSVTLAPGARLVVFASKKNRKVLANRLHTNFRLEASGGSLFLVRPDGFTIEHSYAPYPQQVQDIAYGLPDGWQPIVAVGAAGRAKVPVTLDEFNATFTGWNSAAPFDDSTWQAGQSGFGYDTSGSFSALIGSSANLQTQMLGINASAFVRFAFNVPDPAAIPELRLVMRFDDGFLAYLNGNLVAKNNDPPTPAWNSTATVDRADASINTPVTFALPNAQTFLVAGQNVLAFQLLNHAADSAQAILQPQLEIRVQQTTPAYLSAATPNAGNGIARTDIGPFITETTRQPPRPTGSASSPPLIVIARVTPSLRPVATVQLKSRIMFGAESTLAMLDNGVAPDAIANDGIYTAQLSTTTLGAGQMIRWRVVATDTNGSSATDPPYRDVTDNDQYYGTVALESQTASSLLPVVHWFVQNPSGARSEGGTRCSIYYLGEFYDNVYVNLHGQSSSGFAVDKKSHDLNFSQDNRFKWREGEERVRAVNLLTNWADKSKMRNTIAWEAWANARHIASHWCFPVRVQQNAVFWGVYDMVENGDEDFLKRAGLDENSAFYKMYNLLDNSTTNVEKKTREFENNSDLQALIDGLNTAQSIATRRVYGYDNVDIPALVNSLAVNALINNNDQGHKNYYLYRATNGSGEWSLLPWDQDLAVGHTWTSGPAYFDDDIDSQRGVRNGATNRLKSLCYDASEINQMFVRRMRTLMTEWLIAANATDGPMEQRMAQLVALIDPHDDSAVTGVDDADLDMRRWGFWLDGSGTSIPYTDPQNRMPDHTMRKHVMRIVSSNPVPPYPGSNPNSQQGNSNTLPAFLPGRRQFFFTMNPTSGGVPIPPAQPPVPPSITIEQIDFNPASGNPDQEFFVIRNGGTQSVDVSGWSVSGAVDMTFFGGTVIPAGGGAVDNIGLLHVARNAKAFRQRTVGPHGAEKRLVVGGYNGRLSARGGTLTLTNTAGAVVATTAYVGAPTAAQNGLRVTELNFAPKAPTAAESSALAGVQASDFEFIELANTGASPLDLSNASFDRGITFTFPAGFTLAAGARTLVVASDAAFALRYGSGFNVAGQFEGNFDNSGEEVRLLDGVGEEVLRFVYNRTWYPPTDLGGYSLVTRDAAPAYDGYNLSTAWAISGQPGGSPGTGDTTFSQVFEGWRHDHFTPAEEQNATISSLLADPDGDGLNNALEYAFGRDPRTGEGFLPTDPSLVNVDGVDYLAVTFLRRKNSLDLTFAIEVSGDFVTWTPVNLQVGTGKSFSAELEQVTFRDDQPANGSRFIRVRVTK
jgi:hypothetical protein